MVQLSKMQNTLEAPEGNWVLKDTIELSSLANFFPPHVETTPFAEKRGNIRLVWKSPGGGNLHFEHPLISKIRSTDSATPGSGVAIPSPGINDWRNVRGDDNYGSISRSDSRRSESMPKEKTNTSLQSVPVSTRTNLLVIENPELQSAPIRDPITVGKETGNSRQIQRNEHKIPSKEGNDNRSEMAGDLPQSADSELLNENPLHANNIEEAQDDLISRRKSSFGGLIRRGSHRVKTSGMFLLQFKAGKENGNSRLSMRHSISVSSEGDKLVDEMQKFAMSSEPSTKPTKEERNPVKILRNVVNKAIGHYGRECRKYQTFLVGNTGQSVVVAGLLKQGKAVMLARVDFSEDIPTCIDARYCVSDDSFSFEVLFGFSDGTIVLSSPFSKKNILLRRPNKRTGVSSIQWINNNNSRFIFGTESGLVLEYDSMNGIGDEEPTILLRLQENIRAGSFKCVYNGRSVFNPHTVWAVGSSRINDIKVSPTDHDVLAASTEEGKVFIFNLAEHRLIYVFPSFFGGVNCVSWSSDGKYLVAGGKDDYITLWSFEQTQVVARCEGHDSWVTSIRFDSNLQLGDDEYRFVSVGEDSNVLLWDFSPASLPIHLTAKDAPVDKQKANKSMELIEAQPGITGDFCPVNSAKGKENNTFVIRPVVLKSVIDSPLKSVAVNSRLLFSCSLSGVIKTYMRPLAE